MTPIPPWTSPELILLACAIRRHGTHRWPSVSRELTSREMFVSPVPGQRTPEACHDKFNELWKEFWAGKTDGGDVSSFLDGMTAEGQRLLQEEASYMQKEKESLEHKIASMKQSLLALIPEPFKDASAKPLLDLSVEPPSEPSTQPLQEPERVNSDSAEIDSPLEAMDSTLAVLEPAPADLESVPADMAGQQAPVSQDLMQSGQEMDLIPGRNVQEPSQHLPPSDTVSKEVAVAHKEQETVVWQGEKGSKQESSASPLFDLNSAVPEPSEPFLDLNSALPEPPAPEPQVQEETVLPQPALAAPEPLFDLNCSFPDPWAEDVPEESELHQVSPVVEPEAPETKPQGSGEEEEAEQEPIKAVQVAIPDADVAESGTSRAGDSGAAEPMDGGHLAEEDRRDAIVAMVREHQLGSGWATLDVSNSTGGEQMVDVEVNVLEKGQGPLKGLDLPSEGLEESNRIDNLLPNVIETDQSNSPELVEKAKCVPVEEKGETKEEKEGETPLEEFHTPEDRLEFEEEKINAPEKETTPKKLVQVSPLKSIKLGGGFGSNTDFLERSEKCPSENGLESWDSGEQLISELKNDLDAGSMMASEFEKMEASDKSVSKRKRGGEKGSEKRGSIGERAGEVLATKQSSDTRPRRAQRVREGTSKGKAMAASRQSRVEVSSYRKGRRL